VKNEQKSNSGSRLSRTSALGHSHHACPVRARSGHSAPTQAANGRVAFVFGQPQFDFEDAVAGSITLVLGMLALNLDLDK
jgi:hypothetical protein